MRNIRAGGRIQNLILFIRGNAMSCFEIMIGISQFPKPPNMNGITMKKIMIKA